MTNVGNCFLNLKRLNNLNSKINGSGPNSFVTDAVDTGPNTVRINS